VFQVFSWLKFSDQCPFMSNLYHKIGELAVKVIFLELTNYYHRMTKALLAIVFYTLIAAQVFSKGIPEDGSLDNNGFEIHMVDNGRFSIETGMEFPAEYSDDDSLSLLPAVIFAPGSGSGSVFPSYVPGFQDIFLRQAFLERGYVVIRYNKRGLGHSNGNMRWSSLEGRANDLLAIVDYYRSDDRINPDRIGVVGHSQGGWVVVIAGSQDSHLDFVISLSGPVRTMREQDMSREETDLLCRGFTGSELEKKLLSRHRSHNRMVRFGGIFPFFDLRFMHNSLDYNPEEALRALESQTLLAFAENDSMVRPVLNLDRLVQIFPEGIPPNIEVHVAPDTDHFFHITETTCFNYMKALDDPYSQEFVDFYMDWVEEKVLKTDG